MTVMSYRGAIHPDAAWLRVTKAINRDVMRYFQAIGDKHHVSTLAEALHTPIRDTIQLKRENHQQTDFHNGLAEAMRPNPGLRATGACFRTLRLRLSISSKMDRCCSFAHP